MVEHDASAFQAMSIGISSSGLSSITNESSVSAQPQPHVYDNTRKVTTVGRLQRPPRPRLRVLSTVEHENDRPGEVGAISGMSVGVVGMHQEAAATATATIGSESNNLSFATTRSGVGVGNMQNGINAQNGNGSIPLPQNVATMHALARQRRLETSRSAGSLLAGPLDGGNNNNSIHNMDINGQRLGATSSGSRSHNNSSDLLIGSGPGASASSATVGGSGGGRVAAAASMNTIGNAPRSHQRRRIASIGHGGSGSDSGGGSGGGGITNGGGTGTSQSAVGNMLRDAVIADALVGQGLGQGLGQGQGSSTTSGVASNTTASRQARPSRGGLTIANHGPSSPTSPTLALRPHSISPTHGQVPPPPPPSH